MKLRRVAGLLLTLSAVFAFTACGKKKNKTKTNSSSTSGSGTTTSSTTQSGEFENLLENGDFSTGEKEVASSGDKLIGKWWLYGLVGGSGDFDINKDRQLEVTVKKMTDEMHCVQLGYDGFGISKKSKYVLEFDAKASYNRKIEVRIQENGGNYENYITEGQGGDVLADLTTEMQHFSFEFTSAVNDKAPRLAINCGHFEGDPLEDGGVITFDNFVLRCTYDSGDKGEDPLKRPKIKLNQVGFLPNQKKEAVFVGNAGELDARFYVYNVDTDEMAFSGKTKYIELIGVNTKSMEYVGVGDFSALTTPGKYKLITNYYCGESYEFEIYDQYAGSEYENLNNDLVMMLYRQRCGEVLGADGDKFAHDACHQEEATILGTSTKVDVSGGWHDAGDFGKYVVAGAQTVADLLMTYERYGDVFYYDSYVTGTDASMPDILEEAMYELDWMLKMQAPNGEVYHKVTSMNFPDGNVAPIDDHSALVISPTSYAATADFAAVMARAAVILYDLGFTSKSTEYENAATAAYAALENMDMESFKNPEGVSTGEYPDAELYDELAWASIEMFGLTFDSKYYNAYKANYTKTADLGLGWANVNGFAVLRSLEVINDPDVDLYKAGVKKLLAFADELVEIAEKDAYNTTIKTFEWGSNLSIASNGMVLDYALDYVDPTDTERIDLYYETMQDQVNYLLGENACCYCFVTGYGTLCPENPHHRPSVAAGEAMKGMLVGGPDANFDENGNDSIATQYCKGEAPAFCYIDHNNSWSTNEITIYWNSPLIYLMNALVARVESE